MYFSRAALYAVQERGVQLLDEPDANWQLVEERNPLAERTDVVQDFLRV